MTGLPFARNKRSLSVVLLLFCLPGLCEAQTNSADSENEGTNGPYLLELGYTQTNAKEGNIDVFTPGFTWLVSPNIRVGATTSFLNVKPKDNRVKVGDDPSSSHGLGDSVVFIQYDWDERLTASPWIPNNLGMNLSVLAPTGNARNSLSTDTWAARLSVSWPIISNDEWLLNPLISYTGSFAGGELAQELEFLDFGMGAVRLFPRKFWVGFTPVYWYDFTVNRWNFDYHLVVGKMFSNGMGIGLNYGNLVQQSGIRTQYDTSVLLDFYYQFGQ